MWKAVLVDELREILERDDALARMRGFSTERWLGKMVRDRGTADQIAAFDALLRSLELLDGVEVAEDEDAVRYGLPSDIARPPRGRRTALSGDFQTNRRSSQVLIDPQPLMEVEVYRSLDECDFQVGEDEGEGEDETD